MPEVFFETREVVIVKARVPDDVKRNQDRLRAEGRCLGCEEKPVKGAAVRRGLCPTCYQAALRAMKAKRRSEGQLIREGKLLPPSVGGRPSSNKFTQELSGR